MSTTEDRLRRDLSRLADTVDDEAGDGATRGPARRGIGPRPVLAAAAVLLVVALGVAGYRATSDDGPTDVTADEGGTTVPATTEPAGIPVLTEATVTVAIYSGRRDPTFPLSPDDAAALSELVSGLPPTDEALPVPGLGFRGFRVDGVDETGAAVTWDVRPGLVGIETPTPQVRLDADDLVLQELIRLTVAVQPELGPVLVTEGG